MNFVLIIILLVCCKFDENEAGCFGCGGRDNTSSKVAATKDFQTNDDLPEKKLSTFFIAEPMLFAATIADIETKVKKNAAHKPWTKELANLAELNLGYAKDMAFDYASLSMKKLQEFQASVPNQTQNQDENLENELNGLVSNYMQKAATETTELTGMIRDTLFAPFSATSEFMKQFPNLLKLKIDKKKGESIATKLASEKTEIKAMFDSDIKSYLKDYKDQLSHRMDQAGMSRYLKQYGKEHTVDDTKTIIQDFGRWVPKFDQAKGAFKNLKMKCVAIKDRQNRLLKSIQNELNERQ